MDSTEQIEKSFEELFDGCPIAKHPVPYISIDNCKLAMKGSFIAGYALCQEWILRNTIKK